MLHKNLKPYKALDMTELKCFLGIFILNGIYKMPSYRHFWSSDSLLRIDFVANAMSRIQYDWILLNLYLNDNNKAPNRDDINFDKLYKVRPFITSLCNQFMKNYNPTEHQSIDESMIKFKGRSSLKQYMPLKPTTRGYKMWVRACANGYIL